MPSKPTMRTMLLPGATALAVLALAHDASAADRDRGTGYLEGIVPAPAGAAEITVGGGYTQPFGQITKGGGNNVEDVANAGGAVEVGIASRMTPWTSVGITGAYEQYATGRTIDTESSARGALFGINAQYHFAPFRRADPWVKLGVGYRMLWQSPSAGPNVMYHGFELAKVQVGVDVRASPMLAIGPMIGADLNLLLWQRSNGENTAINDPRVNTFVFAGLQARFDTGGMAVPESAVTTAKR
jgi:hypothetical protein